MNLIRPLFQLFENFRDTFIPQQLLVDGDMDKLYRFRLISGISLIIVILISLFILTFPFISEFNWPGSFISTLLGFVLVVTNVYILRRLKYHHSSRRPAHQLIASLWLTIAVGITITGGVIENNIAAFLQTPVIMAFLILGRRTGIFYALITLLVYSAFSVLELHHANFPDIIPEAQAKPIEVMIWLYFAFCILALSVAYDDLTQQLMLDRQQEQEKQTYLATHDSLTSLANRKKFDDYLNEAIHRADRNQTEVALMIIDLNDFKPVNDTFGHDLGDQILVHVAKQINNTIRADDLGARIGGDEFAIIIQGEIDEKKLEQLVTRLLSNIATPMANDEQSIAVSGSVGIARYPSQACDENELRRFADIAMYHAKNNGKNWCNYTEIPSI